MLQFGLTGHGWRGHVGYSVFDKLTIHTNFISTTLAALALLCECYPSTQRLRDIPHIDVVLQYHADSIRFLPGIVAASIVECTYSVCT